MVGISVCHDALLTVCASSHQQMSVPSIDFSDWTLCYSPAKVISVPLRPRIAVFCTS